MVAINLYVQRVTGKRSEDVAKAAGAYMMQWMTNNPGKVPTFAELERIFAACYVQGLKDAGAPGAKERASDGK